MKKIFTLIFATLMAGNIMAQMHGALRFAGASSVKVLTTNIDNPSDTIKFEMASMSAGNITLPAMKGMATIPSFTIENVAFTMGDNHVISFADQTFASKVTVDGNEKSITGSSLSGTYNMADNSLTLKGCFPIWLYAPQHYLQHQGLLCEDRQQPHYSQRGRSIQLRQQERQLRRAQVYGWRCTEG